MGYPEPLSSLPSWVRLFTGVAEGDSVTQEEAIAVVAALLASQELRPESLFALASAAQAAQTEGISGALIVKIPRKYGPVDVQFTTGSTRLGLDI